MLKIIFVAIIFFSFSPGNFKTEQKKYPRVRTAYAEKEAGMLELLQENSIQLDGLEIYLSAFKYEEELELWAKNKSEDSFRLLKTFKICRTSGTLGPKRKEGDLQIPEGFYHIDAFNPASSFYLSLRINYPNKSDRILGNKQKLGGDIYIHGDCVSIGCVPITDEQIKALYIFCVEAKDNGQAKIPVTVYPARLSDKTFETLKAKYLAESDKVNLWADLKLAYDKFTQSKQLPSITFLEDGRHDVK
ncbi:MAG: L,D-transpeptidase family protein [Bacteroidota bacterium]